MDTPATGGIGEDDDMAMMDASGAEVTPPLQDPPPSEDPPPLQAPANAPKSCLNNGSFEKKRKKVKLDSKTASKKTSSSVQPRSTARRRKAPSKEYSAPGKHKQKDSFIAIDNPEATIASYCGFNDIGRFREFLLSDWVLTFYVRFVKYNGHSHKQRISLLDDDAPYEGYWESDEEPESIYSLEKKEFINNSQKKTELSYGCNFSAFSTLTNRKLPDNILPFPKESLPNFGPFHDLNETDLEPLNRCLCLFAHLRYVTSPTQWDSRFHGRTPWNSSMLVGVDYVPQWMRDTAVAETQAPDEFTAPEELVDQREISVTWKPKSKNQQNQAFVIHIKDCDEYDNITKKVTVNSTRFYQRIRFPTGRA